MVSRDGVEPMISTLLEKAPVNHVKSTMLLDQARKIIPTGASSVLRTLSPMPIFAVKGRGSRLWDADGNEYIDYLLGFGALINGHCHPRIVESIKKQSEEILMSGTPYELELVVAKKIQRMVPNAEMVLFASTGTEATMEAIRIARAVTGKSKIVKFEGAYHGHHDYVLWSVESPHPGLEISPFRIPHYPGIPEAVGKTVVIAPWNNPDTLRKIVRRNKNSIAAIIAEPIMANNGVIMPKHGFLKQLREIADEAEALLIFDEVITGFRIAPGGAQEYFGVNADLATFGKAVGGGVPIAAITGKREILENIGVGKIGFGGTYNAHPLSLAAASANLDILMENGGEAFRTLHGTGEKLMKGLREAVEDVGVKAIVQGLGPMFQVFFTDLDEINSYREKLLTDGRAYSFWALEMFKQGIFMFPDDGERIVISTAHGKEDVEKTVEAAQNSFEAVKSRFS
ncbi:MAG: aspartate aminotransferase family protein [Candidatus Caldarchaeum sp.]|nr:aspartate aminotransferase family protein [Candidatus Caldarchaeum sp.]